MDEAVVEGVYQAHGVLLQDHHQVLALQRVGGTLSLAAGLGSPSTRPMCRDSPSHSAYCAWSELALPLAQLPGLPTPSV